MRRRLCPKEALFTPSFIAVCSANLLFFIASFMMVPVLPIYLLDGLHASKSVVGIILSAYMIGALVMRPLSGFLAERYDESSENTFPRASARIKTTVENVLRNTISGYASVQVTNNDVQIQQQAARNVLLPVWMLSTRWNGKSFLFAMNGQTGKMVGDLPTDAGKYWRTFAAIAAPVALLGTALSFLLR